MDMYSKMDGSTPVSSALDGVWDIQKRGIIKDQKNGKSKKDQDKKEEETEFEDGLVPKEKKMNRGPAAEPKQEENEATEENPPTERKIDIII
jgi:hypothetical protein